MTFLVVSYGSRALSGIEQHLSGGQIRNDHTTKSPFPALL